MVRPPALVLSCRRDFRAPVPMHEIRTQRKPSMPHFSTLFGMPYHSELPAQNENRPKQAEA